MIAHFSETMDIVKQMNSLKHQHLSKIPEEVRDESSNILSGIFYSLTEYAQARSKEILTHYNVSGINIPCLILNINKPSTSEKVFSRTMTVIPGNLNGCNCDPKNLMDGVLTLDVSPPTVKSQTNGATQFKNSSLALVPSTTPLNLKREIRKGVPIMVSIPEAAAKALSNLQMITLCDVKGRAYYTDKNKLVVSIGASSVDPFNNFSISDAFYTLVAASPNNTILSSTRVRYDALLDNKYDGGYVMLKLQGDIDITVESNLKDNSIASINFIQGDDNFCYIDKNKIAFPFLHTLVNVVQWEGERLTETNNEKFIVELRAYEEALKGFYIKNCDVWVLLAPFIISNAIIFAVSQIDIVKTDSMLINILDDKERDHPGCTNGQRAAMPYKCGFSLSCKTLLVDAADTYRNIGVPITAIYAKKMYEDSVYNQKDTTIRKLLHDGNLHSSVSEPPVICLFEYNGDVSHIFANPNAEFRVVTNARISPENMRSIASLSPEEGDELMKIGPKVNSKSQKLNQLRLEPQVQGGLIVKYIFVVFKDRMSTSATLGTTIFLEGKNEQDDEEFQVCDLDDAPNVNFIDDKPEQKQLPPIKFDKGDLERINKKALSNLDGLETITKTQLAEVEGKPVKSKKHRIEKAEEKKTKKPKIQMHE